METTPQGMSFHTSYDEQYRCPRTEVVKSVEYDFDLSPMNENTPCPKDCDCGKAVLTQDERAMMFQPIKRRMFDKVPCERCEAWVHKFHVVDATEMESALLRREHRSALYVVVCGRCKEA